MKLFVSPHNDDAVLFGAFTLLRSEPTVLTVFDSFVQVQRGYAECNAAARRAEDLDAMHILGCTIQFGGVRDDEADLWLRTRVHSALSHWRPQEVWIPAVESGGHEQHNLVGEIGAEVFVRAKVHRYLTYTGSGKSRWGQEVAATGAMIRKKLQALACYKTQLEIEALNCFQHFARDLSEWMVPE
jgi:LmbE family N-acetylglucosaminyl deacetylase